MKLPSGVLHSIDYASGKVVLELDDLECLVDQEGGDMIQIGDRVVIVLVFTKLQRDLIEHMYPDWHAAHQGATK